MQLYVLIDGNKDHSLGGHHRLSETYDGWAKQLSFIGSTLVAFNRFIKIYLILPSVQDTNLEILLCVEKTQHEILF